MNAAVNSVVMGGSVSAAICAPALVLVFVQRSWLLLIMLLIPTVCQALLHMGLNH